MRLHRSSFAEEVQHNKHIDLSPNFIVSIAL